MRILFLHQNFPAQYRHVASAIAADRNNTVVALGCKTARELPGIKLHRYEPSRAAHPSTHPYLQRLENGVLHGQAAARRMLRLRREGFLPDVVCAHPGWGEALFVKEVLPEVPVLNYCEFYYHAFGTDSNFDPSEEPTLDGICRTRLNNAVHLLSIQLCDWGVAPTEWQRSVFPAEFHNKISVIHDGIDCDVAKPDPSAKFTLPNGTVLSAADEVVTYVSRSLEPHRGFPTFMRAVAESCRRRPNCHFVIVGADNVSYGAKRSDGKTHREALLQEVVIDPKRVHFLGRVPYESFMNILQVSSAHVYLTVPFVLSWSMLEAMAAGCLLIGSDTPPVREVIDDGRNGLLVDFFSPSQVADRIDEALDRRAEMAPLREAARRTVLERYALSDCLAAHLRLIRDGAEKKLGNKAPPPARESHLKLIQPKPQAKRARA